MQDQTKEIGQEEKWRFLQSRTVDAVVQRFHPGQHQYDSENRFLDIQIERIISETQPVWEIVLLDQAKRPIQLVKMMIEVSSTPKIFLPEYKEMLLQPSGIKQVHALYPCEAQHRCLSYLLEVETEMLHKRYVASIPADPNQVPQWSLEYAETFTVLDKPNILVGGSYCRTRRTGMMCNEDPDDPQCYFIHEGMKKYVESHTTMRGSFPYVYFYADAALGNVGTVDLDLGVSNNNVLIECDYRPANEYWQRTGAAIHFYLTVPNAVKHRRMFEELKAQRPVDRDYAIDVYQGYVNMNSANTYLSGNGVVHDETMEYEWMAVAIQSLAACKVAVSLPALFAMLGVVEREQMMSFVLPFYRANMDQTALSQPQQTLIRVLKRVLSQPFNLPVAGVSVNNKSATPNILHFLQTNAHDDKLKEMQRLVRDPTLYANPYLKEAYDVSHAGLMILNDGRHQLTLADLYVYYAYQLHRDTAADCLKRLFDSLNNEVFLNIGVDNFSHFSTLIAKQWLTGQVVLKVLCVALGLQEPDDIDHFDMKRVVTIGPMETTIYRNARKASMANLSKDISAYYTKHGRYTVRDLLRRPDVKTIFEPLVFYSPMSTGNFPLIRGGADTTGVVQICKDYGGDTVAAAEQLRRVRIRMHAQCKFRAPHELHASHDGRFCVTHTPHNKSAGLQIYLAMGAHVRIGYDATWLIRPIMDHPAHRIKPLKDFFSYPNGVLVCLNGPGSPIGFTTTPWQTLMALRQSRTAACRNLLPWDVSVTWIGGPFYRGGPLRQPYCNYVHISGDDGAVLRPLLVTSQLYKLEHLVACYLHSEVELHDALVNEGVMVYLDNEEEEHSALVCSSLDKLRKKQPWWFCLDDQARKQGLSNYHRNLHHCYQDDILAQTEMTESTCALNRHCKPNKPPYTHVKISDDFITGLQASETPNYNFNNGTRNTFGTNMKSQAAVPRPMNWRYRKTQPMFTTLIKHASLNGGSELSQMMAVPTTQPPGNDIIMRRYDVATRALTSNGNMCGEPTFVSVASDAFNGEDATKRVAPQAGQHYTIRTMQLMAAIRTDAVESNLKLAKERLGFFGKPSLDTCLGIKSSEPGAYDALDAQGLPICGKLVKPGAAFVGRLINTLMPIEHVDHGGKSTASKQKYWYRDNSDINMTEYTYMVVHVIQTTSGTGAKVLHVTLQALMVPALGDKGSNAHGQKGVLAKISPSCHMPSLIHCGYDLFGRKWCRILKPDLVMGPHGIPSRMTLGQTHESHQSLLRLGWKQTLGLSDSGRGEFECLDGVTGRKLKAAIYTGWINYFTLEHFATKNANNRTKGAIDMRTRQPVRAKINNGGIRQGYMEIANLYVHGATSLVREVISWNSDGSLFDICRGCGLFVVSFHKTCGVCHRDDLLVSIVLPYTLFLTAMELYAAGIALRFVFSKPGETVDKMQQDEEAIQIMDDSQMTSLMNAAVARHYELPSFSIHPDQGVMLNL